MRSLLSHLFAFSALLSVLVLSGCKTAHVNYSLADVRPLPPRGSGFSGQTLFVERFQDSRYKDKKSVSTYVKKSGMYGSHAERSVVCVNAIFASVT